MTARGSLPDPSFPPGGLAGILCAAAPGGRLALVTHLGWLRAVWPGADFAHAEWRIARSEALLRGD